MQEFMQIDKSSEQIRGHHIKMKKKLKSITNILRLLPKEIKRKEKNEQS